MMEKVLHLLSELAELGRLALRHDPSVDKFSAYLGCAKHVWKRELPHWADLGEALYRALETRPQDVQKPYAELGSFFRELEKNPKLRSQLGRPTVGAIRLLALGASADHTPQTEEIEKKLDRIERELLGSSQAFWNAALILLFRRWKALLEERQLVAKFPEGAKPNQIQLAWPRYHKKRVLGEEMHYDGWVDVRCDCNYPLCPLVPADDPPPFVQSSGDVFECPLILFFNEREADPRIREYLSDYHARILGFGLTKANVPEDSSDIESYPGDPLKIRAGSTITAIFQVSNGELALVERKAEGSTNAKTSQANDGPNLVDAPRAIAGNDRLDVLDQMRDPNRPRIRYLGTMEGQAFRLILRIKDSSSSNSSSIWLDGEYIVDKANVPAGFVREEHIQLNPSRGELLMILVRYRDKLGPGWATPRLSIPIEIIS